MIRPGQIKNKKPIVASIPLIAILALAAVIAAVWRHDPMGARYSASDEVALATQVGAATGLLRANLANPRYFADGNGKAIYLTGSHTWTNFQEITDHSQGTFDYPNYLRVLANKNHNFMRMWVWEQAAWAPWTKEKVEFSPLPYQRSGKGTALDGRPRFDLTQFNQAYFDRLRSRVEAAGKQGIYVSVMLFQGWSAGKKPNEPGNPWRGHPFNRDNNVNGIDGDLNGDGEGIEVHTLENPAVTALQETYVREVVNTVNDLDNVLWEICNEGSPGSMNWQNHMVAYIKNYELTMEKQHPVGLTALYPRGKNDDLYGSLADWISPSGNGGEDYETNPPAADGSKVILSDTDHVWGVGGDRGWVWKSFLRGLNPIYMDPLDDPRWSSSRLRFESCRTAMGHTLALANRMNLITMTPHGEFASTGYCLADPGEEYLVYIPFHAPEAGRIHLSFVLRNPIRNFLWQFKRRVTVNLSSASGTFLVEWFNPSTGESRKGAPVVGGRDYSFTAPSRGDAVLYIRKKT